MFHSGFPHEVDYICALLGHYAAYRGKFFADVSGQSIVNIFKN